MFFAAALSFAACEPSEGDELSGDLLLSVNPKIILCDGVMTATFEARVGNKVVTDGLTIFDGDNKVVDLPGMKFSTTKEGVYTFWATRGDLISNEVTVTAVKELPKATEIPLDPEPKNTSFVRKVMLMQFTGTNCPWCPFMTDCIDALPKVLRNKYILTAIHRFNGDDPAFITDALEQTMAVGGFPTLGVDMHSVEGNRYPALVRNLVQNAVDREQAKVGIAACASYAAESRMLSVKAEVKAAVTDNYRIGAWLLEDGIYGKQANNGATGRDSYDTHDCCVRIADSKVTNTNYTGYYLGEIKAGEKKLYEFNNMTLDPSWKVENCRLVIFVTCEGAPSEGTINTWYVNNIVECPINGSVAYQYK